MYVDTRLEENFVFNNVWNSKTKRNKKNYGWILDLFINDN